MMSVVAPDDSRACSVNPIPKGCQSVLFADTSYRRSIFPALRALSSHRVKTMMRFRFASSLRRCILGASSVTAPRSSSVRSTIG